MARNSGQVLDVAGASTEDGARIIQWDWHGGDNQRFRLEPLGDGYVHIVAKHSGKVLDVAGASARHGAPAHPVGLVRQRQPALAAHRADVAEHSGKGSTSRGGSRDNGAD